MKYWHKIQTYGRMIKFSHTIFALPFALAAVILGNREKPITPGTLFWIIIAMASARSAAMGFNRWADSQIDAQNPRTSERALPKGLITKRATMIFIVLSSTVFILSAGFLGKTCFYWSFPVLFVLFSYSYTKRFTKWSHLHLGFAIGMAPLGAWIAVTDSFSWRIVILSLALMTYISGFDILYSCQDIEFDRGKGLFSLPAATGPETALKISSILHFLMFTFLFTLYWTFHLQKIYLVFVIIIGFLLIVEHLLVSPDDLSKVNISFFHVNSLISLLIFLAVLADEIMRRIYA